MEDSAATEAISRAMIHR